jgi:hypothetical protein
MRVNTVKKTQPVFTAPGAIAVKVDNVAALRRSVLTCLLWENSAYEDGKSITDRIVELARLVTPEELAAIAIEARHEQHLRHVPLLLTSILASRAKGKLVVDTIVSVVSRADELGELLAVHAKLNGVGPDQVKKVMTHAMRRGLARTFDKFDAYQLAKYAGDREIRIRDVMFLVHPKPSTPERKALYDALASDTLAAPDTWEVEAARGKDKKATFTRLLSEGKLGYMALLKNLRGMTEAGVDHTLISEAIRARKGAGRVLPFRFLSAARHAPRFERDLDAAMIAALEGVEKLPGKTVFIVDVSGSMQASLSSRGGWSRSGSETTRLDTAAALTAMITGVCENPVVYATAGSDGRRVHDTRLIPARQGMAMVDAIHKALRDQGYGGIFLTQCMDYVAKAETDADRVIVITDEADCETDALKKPANANAFGKRNYLINISVEKNGIAYKPKWVHIDGWSENVIRFIAAHEASTNNV